MISIYFGELIKHFKKLNFIAYEAMNKFYLNMKILF